MVGTRVLELWPDGRWATRPGDPSLRAGALRTRTGRVATVGPERARWATGGVGEGPMADLEALRRFGLVLEMAEAAGDGDWRAWTAVLGGLDEDTRADVVRQSSLVIAMLCEREAERRGITRDQFLAQFRAEAMDSLG
ncbi:hypothetical protein GCM10023328_26740 [Modestobacter marinus]|uniref:Uncharacterized protein n=2 Tax=Modestobacter marinus TaxID=477641 RepID=A0ABQ2G9L4_9ACTN|nr:hypothetical protein GCM10011589_42340 [Modestobacter marinus]